MSLARPAVAVVEDEPLARERLARLVREHGAVELAAVCANGAEALAALRSVTLDILLLDIEMPGLHGMDLLRRVRQDTEPPLAILTTAHAQFALDAFAEQAVDYLLKPFDTARLHRALDTAIERLQARAALATTERVRRALGDRATTTQPTPVANAPLMVRSEGRIRFVPPERIQWIEACGRACILHCAANTRFEIAGALSRLAESLPPYFVAISRTVLVNTRCIVELQELFKGNAIALLDSGAQLRVSRRFGARLLESLKQGSA
jgi:two-component system LytT family response regulator